MASQSWSLCLTVGILTWQIFSRTGTCTQGIDFFIIFNWIFYLSIFQMLSPFPFLSLETPYPTPLRFSEGASQPTHSNLPALVLPYTGTSPPIDA